MNLPKIDLYADGAKIDDMMACYKAGHVAGFTTNPSLMAKAGVTDYKVYAKEVCSKITDMPISFEVFSDDFSEMKEQAKIIREFGPNANVKIPITNTKSEFALELIRDLLDEGTKLNVTALFTQTQIDALREILKPEDDVIVSIFAGRIADTGRDPNPVMKKAVADYKDLTGSKILWASTREAYNIWQAAECGVHIITVPPGILGKLNIIGKDLSEYSLDTVKAFYKDATESKFTI